MSKKQYTDPQRTLRDKLRQKYPGLARAAASRGERGGGAIAAIHMFCRECFGGSNHDALACETTDCFLWPHWRERVERYAEPADSPTQKPSRGTDRELHGAARDELLRAAAGTPSRGQGFSERDVRSR